MTVDIDLDLGSIGYSSSASNNYQFRVFLSKMEDMITPESELGKNCLSLIVNFFGISMYLINVSVSFHVAKMNTKVTSLRKGY